MMSASLAFIDDRAHANLYSMFNDERARSDRRPKGVSGSHVASYFV